MRTSHKGSGPAARPHKAPLRDRAAAPADAHRTRRHASCWPSPRPGLRPSPGPEQEPIRSRPTNMPQSSTRCCALPLLLGGLRLVCAEHGNGFNLNQQFGPAKDGLDAGGSWQRVESLLLEEGGPLLVKGLVVALNVAQIAGCAHNVVPGASFAFKQSGDVLERAPQLGAKVADMHAYAMLIDRSCAGDQQDHQPIEIDSHAA